MTILANAVGVFLVEGDAAALLPYPYGIDGLESIHIKCFLSLNALVRAGTFLEDEVCFCCS